MKIYNSLDCESQKMRLEPSVAGDYLVHVEDFENVNDIISRAVRTRTEPNYGSKYLTEYDDLDKYQVDIEDYINNPNDEGQFDLDKSAEGSNAERSKAQEPETDAQVV